MKKITALTLIEVLLVLAVIAVIMLVGANQLQRYQANRNIQQAKASVAALSNFVVDLYLANCVKMLWGKTNYVCPTSFAKNIGASANSDYCYRTVQIANPLYKNASSSTDNFLIGIKLFNGSTPLNVPQLMVALPVSLSAATINSSTTMEKYIAALSPTQIAAGSGSSSIYPNGSGYYAPDGTKGASASSDPCLKGSGQPICLEWIITPNNWGTLKTQTNNNQALTTRTNAAVVQYAPTTADWKSISSDVYNQSNKTMSPQIQCPGLVAGQYYQQQH